MSFNQDIIDFMNGTNRNKKNENIKNYNLNEKKYEKNNEKQLDDELYIATVHSEGSDNNDDDDDRMATQLSPSVAPTKAFASPDRHPMNKTLNNFKKSYYQTVIEWVEIDQQQIYPTLQSILNLRQRLYHTYQYSSLLSPPSIDDDDDNDVHGPSSKSISASSSLPVVEWSNNGYRHRTKDTAKKSYVGGTLNYDDIQLTIQNNLQHHERMTVQLRHLMSELSDMTNRMSRRYDDLYHAACASMDSVVDPRTTLDVWSAMDDCQILYITFAKELYRKQTLITQMIDTPILLVSSSSSSSHGSNDVLGATNDESNDHLTHDEEAVADENNTERQERPIRIAKQCTLTWSYSSKCSYFYPLREFVQDCIERYQTSSK